jgi:AraC-like DNA-binding protein
MSKKNIKATFYSKEPLGNDSLQLVGWSGNHWDDISFFPKNFQIGLIRQGKGEFIFGDTVIPIEEGQLFLIHPGKIHSGKPDETIGWTVDTIAIKKEFVEELISPNVQITFPEFVVDDADLKKDFKDTLDLLANYQSSLEYEGRLYLLLTELIKRRATILQNNDSKEKPTDAVDRATAFINKNFKTSFSLDELADQSYLSKFHLLRLFKSKVGLTPYSYQIQLRLNEARRLIFEDKSLSEVAYELGFSDQAHFTNTFKKHANGANPSDLLKTAISYNFKE